MELERPVSTIDRGSTTRPGDIVSSKDCKELLKILSHAMHREQEVEVKLNNIDRVSIRIVSMIIKILTCSVYRL